MNELKPTSIDEPKSKPILIRMSCGCPYNLPPNSSWAKKQYTEIRGVCRKHFKERLAERMQTLEEIAKIVEEKEKSEVFPSFFYLYSEVDPAALLLKQLEEFDNTR